MTYSKEPDIIEGTGVEWVEIGVDFSHVLRLEMLKQNWMTEYAVLGHSDEGDYITVMLKSQDWAKMPKVTVALFLLSNLSSSVS